MPQLKTETRLVHDQIITFSRSWDRLAFDGIGVETQQQVNSLQALFLTELQGKTQKLAEETMDACAHCTTLNIF